MTYYEHVPPILEPQLFEGVPSVYVFKCPDCGAETSLGNEREQVPLPLIEECRRRVEAAHRCTPPDAFG